jgi:hypothetical protein
MPAHSEVQKFTHDCFKGQFAESSTRNLESCKQKLHWVWVLAMSTVNVNFTTGKKQAKFEKVGGFFAGRV